MSEQNTLYTRLGGYDAISAVVENLLPRLISDARLGRFWSNRGDDGIAREKQLLTDYLCSNSGGPVLYIGRNNQISHRGMGINGEDWVCFIEHLQQTLTHFQVPNAEREEVLAFIESTRVDIVE